MRDRQTAGFSLRGVFAVMAQVVLYIGLLAWDSQTYGRTPDRCIPTKA